MHDEITGSIIVDHDILKESYIPDRLKGREDQCEQILSCLSPVFRKHKPIHTWLHGQPGTGKTATAMYILRQLEEQTHVKGIIINCWQKRTFYQILDEMISELRILRAEEHRASFKLEKLRSYLKNHPLVVVLDEIDQINPGELSTVLYNLDSTLNAGLICISNSIDALINLEDRVRSRLNPHTVFFPKYPSRCLLEILAHRARLSMSEGSWSEAMLRRIAVAAYGDARAAIRMLGRAAVLAEHQKMDEITIDSLQKQIEAAKESRKTSILNNLTKDHRIIYEIIKTRGRILSGDLWQAYLRRCERIKRRPLAARTFSDYCNRLVHTKLITSERARVRGKVRLFKPKT